MNTQTSTNVTLQEYFFFIFEKFLEMGNDGITQIPNLKIKIKFC